MKGVTGGVPRPGRLGEEQRGFTLAECLVALLLLGMAVLVAASLLTSLAGLTRRMDAESELLRAVEAVHEASRAGAVPLRSGPVAAGLLPRPELDDLRIILDVRRTDVAGLYEIRVRGDCTFAGSTLERRITTMVWQP